VETLEKAAKQVISDYAVSDYGFNGPISIPGRVTRFHFLVSGPDSKTPVKWEPRTLSGR